MTNLTLQPYSTKLAKHQPPDWRHPTENESAGLRKTAAIPAVHGLEL